MIKKILAMMFCVILLASQSVIAQEEEYAYFEPAAYSEAVRFMTALGIMNKEDDSLTTEDWTISRGEFTKLALMAAGENGIAESLSLTSPFMDVGGEHPYFKAIVFAAQTNYFGKDIGTFFRPDDALTLEFAARLGVALTGRSILIGGSRTYVSVANSIDLFDKVETYEKDKISRGGALMFLKNVLEANPLTADSAGTDGKIHGVKTDKSKTVLTNTLGLEKREGVVTSDGLTTVYGEKPTAGYITIDGEKYLNLYEGAYGLAGKRVEFYIEPGDNVPPIRYIEEKKNTVIILDTKSILGFDAKTSSYTVIMDGKTATLKLQQNTYIAYNFESDYDPERMKPASGVVTLIDHDEDGIYDAVLIQSYTNVVVDSYNSYSETIYDYEDSTKNVDLSKYDSFTIVREGGVTMEPEELAQQNIVSVYESGDKKNVRLEVSVNKKTGTLREMNLDEAALMIGSQPYKLSKDVRFDTNALQPGTEYAFYLDSFGEVAYVTTDGGTVAYLLEVAKGTGLSDKVQVQVLSEDTGKLTVYDLASNVLMETPAVKESKKRTEVYNMLRDGANCRRQMVLVKFNDNEEIKAITTPMEITTYRQSLTAPEYPLYHLPYLLTEWPSILGGDNASMTWRYTANGFNRWVILGSGAQMFHVPNGNDAVSDPDSIATEQLDYREQDISINKDMGYYTKDIQDISVRYLVNYGSVAEEDPTKSKKWPVMVTDIVECYSEKLGDSTYRLTLAGASGDDALLTLDSTVIQRDKLWEASALRADKTQLEVGDVIRYTADDAGFIRKISVIYDAKAGIEKDYNDNGDTAARFGTITSAYTQTSWSTTDFTANVGNLVRKRGNVIELSIDKTPTIQTETERLQRFTWGKSNTAIMVDYSGPRPKVTRDYPANDLVVGDRILSIGRAGQYYYSFAFRR